MYVWYVWVGMYGMLEYKLCCEILLLLNMVGMDRWKTGVSNAEYFVHLVCMNGLYACRVLWCAQLGT